MVAFSDAHPGDLRKVVAITAAVGHLERGRLGLQALRTTLRAIDAEIVWDEAIVLGENAASPIRDLLEVLAPAVSRELKSQ